MMTFSKAALISNRGLKVCAKTSKWMEYTFLCCTFLVRSTAAGGAGGACRFKTSLTSPQNVIMVLQWIGCSGTGVGDLTACYRHRHFSSVCVFNPLTHLCKL